jgi:hypothetical protein
VLILIVHWEFQKRADPHMGLRVHRYQGAIQGKHGHEVLSLVLVIDSKQKTAVRVAGHRVGPISQTGWVSISLPRLAMEWPEETDSPMAEMLRALTVGRLEPGYLRGFLERLRRLGLSEIDCREIIMMLSFLLDVRHGGDGVRYQQIVDEVLTMLQLEDSWIYQVAFDRGIDRGIDKALCAMRRGLAMVYQKRHGEVPPAIIEALDQIRDLSRLEALMPVFLNESPTAIGASLAETAQRPC